MRHPFIGLIAWAGLQMTAAAMGEAPSREPFVAGWGIDACLSRHVTEQDFPRYLQLLEASSVRILRERGVGELLSDGTYRDDARARYQWAKARGCSIVAFASPPARIPLEQIGNVLAEDLFKVFAQGRILGRDCAGLVDAWEMVGEPDIGFCTDLPDRVAAYQKALYLGLKAGAAEAAQKPETGNLIADGSEKNSGLRSQPSGLARAPLVLMGALGMPPGPWLERAAANGLLDYTDAYNFHFYGHAKDLTGVITAHRAAIAALMKSENRELKPETDTRASSFNPQPSRAASLPMWITECGIEAVDKKDFFNAERRQLQADFTVATAKQALAVDDVAVFMPFILVHDKDPHALTLSAEKPLPAWDAYAKFTRDNPWPERPLARPPANPNPIVVQWLPDNQTCVPRKVSGTYRFRGKQPIRGELRICNFGSTAVEGRIEAEGLKNVVVLNRGMNPFLQPISVPPMEMKTIPLEFTVIAEGYFREFWKAAFVEEAGRRSAVSFGLETWAEFQDFIAEPLALHPFSGGIIRFPQVPGYKPGEQAGVWSTINELRVAQAASEEKAKPGEYSFWIERRNSDPLAPAMAVAGINGLPGQGFIRMQLDKPMTKARKVLVVLVDDRGQRYTIWENFGADYYGSRSDLWLNLEDFHADFWGPCSADYRFSPQRVREVHLRFYLDDPGDVVGVRLSLLRATSRR